MTPARAAAGGEPASLRRRLACFAYEGVLLFGVVMATGLAYGLLVQQRHALHGLRGLQLTLFVVLGLYFVWFWSRSGQTLAMKTWRIQLVGRDGRPPTPARALLRYLLSWLWFLPALLAAWAAQLHSTAAIAGVVAAGVLGYAALTRASPQRQYLHDRIAGTRLLLAPAPPPR